MKKKRRLKIKLSNRWLYFLITLGILAIVSMSVYAYGTFSPSTFGHSSGEINVDNTLCNAITGHNCGYDSGGSLWSTKSNKIYYNLGNVGIGTSNPSYKLDVVAPADKWKARFSGPDGYITIGPANSGWAHIYTDRKAFIFNAPVYSYANAFSSYNGDLLLQTVGTTRMTISTSGNVNIGGALQVGGSVKVGNSCSAWGQISKCTEGSAPYTSGHVCTCTQTNFGSAFTWRKIA